MSSIVFGAAASHSTLMNTHWDQVVHTDRAERFRDSLLRIHRELKAAQPDVAIIIGSNHFRGFWLDLIPSFTIGVGEVIAAGEAGTPKGPQLVMPELAQYVARYLIDRELDIAISAKLQIDHGQSHAIQYLLKDLAIPVIPIVINVFAQPLPTVQRAVTMGRLVGEAVRAYGDNLRVAILASGGLSHQLPWPSDWSNPQNEDEEFMADAWLNGRGEWEYYDKRRREIVVAAQPCIFEDFDEEFLRNLGSGHLEKYVDFSTDGLEAVAGNGGQELRTWLAAAAALKFVPGEVLCYSPMPEWLTGMGSAIFQINEEKGSA